MTAALACQGAISPHLMNADERMMWPIPRWGAGRRTEQGVDIPFASVPDRPRVEGLCRPVDGVVAVQPTPSPRLRTPTSTPDHCGARHHRPAHRTPHTPHPPLTYAARSRSLRGAAATPEVYWV